MLLSCRYKDYASFKLDAIQKQLSESVPLSALESANKQHAELTASYRELLQREQAGSMQVIGKNPKSIKKSMSIWSKACLIQAKLH